MKTDYRMLMILLAGRSDWLLGRQGPSDSQKQEYDFERVNVVMFRNAKV